MALLNNHYVFVQTEDMSRGVSVSEHPVEEGLNITDNVKREPKTISISGEIVGKKAKETLEKIEKLHQNGEFVNYIGQNTLKKALITSFDTSHPNTIYGGCSFSMEIKEVRIAKSPIVIKKTVSQQQVVTEQTPEKNERTYTVKRGDCLWNIAKKYYGNGAQYTKIYNANKGQIKNPDLIYPGQVFVIP